MSTGPSETSHLLAAEDEYDQVGCIRPSMIRLALRPVEIVGLVSILYKLAGSSSYSSISDENTAENKKVKK